MDFVMDITTILANIITIIGFSSVILFLINYFRGKMYLKIYLDYHSNLKTTKKKIEKIIIKLIKSPENIRNVKIINKENKKSINEIINLDPSLVKNSMKKIILADYYKFNDDKINVFIKRGLNLLTSKHALYILVGSINIVDIAIEYIISFYKINYRNDQRIAKIHIPIDNNELFIILHITEYNYNYLKSNTKIKNNIYYLNENVDNYILKIILPTIIYKIATEDKYWNGNIFIKEEKILLIFDYHKWSFAFFDYPLNKMTLLPEEKK
jgi:hypothetical protein